MSAKTYRAETPLQALLLEQALLLAKQLESSADAAPDGQVLTHVEALAVPAARELARQAIEATLQAQAEAVEKKGRLLAPAPAGGASGTKAPPAASSPSPTANSPTGHRLPKNRRSSRKSEIISNASPPLGISMKSFTAAWPRTPKRSSIAKPTNGTA